MGATLRNSASVASIVSPRPGAPMMRSGNSNMSSLFRLVARKVVSGAGLTIERKDSSSRTYSVARRRNGLAMSSAVPVSAEEEGMHRLAVLAVGFRPQERDGVVDRKSTRLNSSH